MSCPCDEVEPVSPRSNEETRRWSPRRWVVGLAQWAIPAAILGLMPKCPACLALYLALGTGLALSKDAAGSLRIALITLSLGWLVALGTRSVLRARKSKPDGDRPAFSSIRSPSKI